MARDVQAQGASTPDGEPRELLPWPIAAERAASSIVGTLGGRTLAKGVTIVDGDRTWIHAWGPRDVASEEPFTESTPFEIGEMSELFTGLLFADAVQRGEVGWTDTLSQHLLDVTVADYQGTPITLMDLASQTVSFPIVPKNLLVRSFEQDRPVYTIELFREYLSTFEHRFRPGTAFSPSDISTALLAMALSHRAGKPYGQLLHERIFEPLRMHASGFDAEGIGTDALPGWSYERAVPPRHAGSPLSPCCTVRTTLHDVTILLRAVAGGSSPLARQFAELAAPRRRIEGAFGMWATLGPIALPRTPMLMSGGILDGVRVATVALPSRRQGLFIVANNESAQVETAAMALVDTLFRPVPSVGPSSHGRFVVDRPPPEATATDVLFGDFARVVAWTAPAGVRAGDTARIRLYFKVLRTPDEDWEIRADLDGPPQRVHVSHYPGGGSDSTRFWKPGELVVDDFEIGIPSDVKAETLYVCFNFSTWYARAEIVPEPKDDVRLCGPKIAVLAHAL